MEFPDPIKPDQEPEDEGKLPEPNEPVKQKSKFGFYRENAKTHPGKSDKISSSMGEPMIGSLPANSIETLISQHSKSAAQEAERPGPLAPEMPQADRPAESLDKGVPPRSEKDMNPGRRLHAMEEAAKSAPPNRIPWKYRMRPTRETTRRAYWDVTATLSLLVNAILVTLLIVLAGQVQNLKSTVNDLLGGLYGNFVKMDQASIDTTITVNTDIPLSFDLPVSQNTEVVLTGDVKIPNAHVVISTGGLNINAPANVTLPAGTILPITLNTVIPVQSTIPISLQVPVNIPLNQTGLHEPFTGLQTTLRPLYCTLDKNAQYPEGTFICAEHDSPTPVAP